MSRPAFAHVLGYTVLTVILTAGAAQSLAGTNTVTTDDIVDNNVTTADFGTNSVTKPKMADNSVATAEIVNGSITANDIASGVFYLSTFSSLSAAAGETKTVTALCNAGDKAISGGSNQSTTDLDIQNIRGGPGWDTAALDDGWSVQVTNEGAVMRSLKVWAVCFNANPA